MRPSILITVANKTLTKKQWAEYLKVDISVLYKQAKHKPFEEVVWSRLPLHERGPFPTPAKCDSLM